MRPCFKRCLVTVQPNYIKYNYVCKRYNLVNLAPSPPSSIPHVSSLQDKLEQFATFLSKSKRPLIISGAGISTESGIPDYRSPSRINKYSPIKYQEFISSMYHRRRYWARSTLGYETQMKVAKPNISHHIITKWKLSESFGNEMRLITQNVDSLHLKSKFPYFDMLEIHGSLRDVSCLSCHARSDRDEFQSLLKENNPEFFDKNKTTTNDIGNDEKKKFELRPDGDIAFDDDEYDYNSFIIPKCKYCNAKDSIRPNVIFFGENLEKTTANTSINWSKNTDCIIVCGSSLQTQSSHRLLRYAREENESAAIVIVNIGETRADDICNVKLEYYVSDVLKYVDHLLSR